MREWVPAIAVGTAIIAFLSFWLGAVTTTGVGVEAPHGTVEYFLERYQTTLASIFAVAAAVIGARAVYGQIRQADELASDVRRRKARATRSMLPLSLSSLMDYAEDCLKAMNDLRPQCVSSALPSPTPTPPSTVEWPDEAVLVMKDYIELADDDVARSLVALLAKLQVQRSRSGEVFRHAKGIKARATPLTSNLENYVIDAAEIYARAASLFDHARAEGVVVPIDGANVITALNLLGMDEFTEATIYASVKARKSWELKRP